MTLHIDLPEDLQARLADRATESGFDTVEQFAEALLRAEAGPSPLPAHVEEELTRRLNNTAPGIEFTPEFEAAFLKEIRDRRPPPRD